MSTPIEDVIKAAREVAASPEAKDLARRSGGRRGVWTADDEERLRAGKIRIPRDDGRFDTYELRGNR